MNLSVYLHPFVSWHIVFSTSCSVRCQQITHWLSLLFFCSIWWLDFGPQIWGNTEEEAHSLRTTRPCEQFILWLLYWNTDGFYPTLSLFPFWNFILSPTKSPMSFYDYDYLIPSSSKPFTFFPVNFYLVHTCKNQSFETQTSLETVSEKWKRNKKRKNSKLNRSQYFKSRAVNLLGVQSLDLLQAIISKSVTLVITNLNICKTNRSSLMLCSMQPSVKKQKSMVKIQPTIFLSHYNTIPAKSSLVYWGQATEAPPEVFLQF